MESTGPRYLFGSTSPFSFLSLSYAAYHPQKFGFRELPTLIYPDKQGVTLTCPKSQEAACYRDRFAARRMFQFLPAICSRVPVHVIWGAIDDSVASEVKERSTDPLTGRKMASIQRIEGVGHLVSVCSLCTSTV
ncbi:hypothetical protein Clacol_008833 [Clathrus columnatus]|uniref:Uncharacterized protein n=1 Tax=Clathrus columnatus TaxID=1419009 RepID=A0AAV5AM55_9AGAM|nr:hypothetical protein Clacol_008833 [Clathrus columnatus]